MSIKSALNIAKLALRENAPTIKVVTGVIVAVGGTVVACKATLKAQEVVGSYEDDKNEIEASEDAKEVSTGLAKRRIKLVAELGLCYAPAAGMIAIGTALIFNGHFQLKGRYVAATTAAAAFQKALVDYRQRVADRYGKNEENDIWNSVTRKSVTVKDDDGKKHKVDTPMVTYANTSPLAICFSGSYNGENHSGSRFAVPNRPDLNLMMLKNAVRNAQDQLQIRGFMTVYTFITDYLGMEPEALALDNPMLEMTWGWKYTPDNSDPTSDNFIDIGIFEDDFSLTRQADDYLRGLRDNLLLNINATPLFAIDSSYENKLSDILDREAPNEK